MNFVTSVFKKYIKNETQQENDRTTKLVAEPSDQKPRRSVLKEFDPLASDSPLPLKLKSIPENIPHSIDLDKVQSSETSLQENYITEQISQLTEPRVKTEVLLVIENELGSMIDSLELPRPEENIPGSESSLVTQNTSLQEIFWDSLEVLKPEENPELLKTGETPLTFDIQNLEDELRVEDSLPNMTFDTASSNLTTPGLDTTFEAVQNSSKLLMTESSTQSTNSNHENINDSNREMDHTFDELSTNAASENLIAPQHDTIFETIKPIIENEEEIIINEEAPLKNVTLNNIFETLSADPVKSQCELSQNDKTSAAVNSELDLDLDGQLPQREISVVEHSGQIISSDTNSGSVNTELNTTFGTPFSDTVESKTDQLLSVQTNASKQPVPDSTSKPSTAQNILVVKNENVNSNKNEEINKTLEIIDEIIAAVEKNSNQAIEFVRHDETELQKTTSHMQKKRDSNTDDTSLNKTFDTPLNENNTLIAETKDDKGIFDGTELNKTFEAPSELELKILVNSTKQSVQNDETTEHEHTFVQSVSLNDIVSVEPSVQNDVPSSNTERMSSEPQVESSFVINGSENINSPYSPEEQAAESSRVIEVLAQSLNQTIDVEESAIVDDINSSKSPNTSEDLSKESLNSVENNKDEGSSSVTESKDCIKSKIIAENQKSNKILERKETEEFEDLEKYIEEAQNEETCIREFNTSEASSKPNEESLDNVVDPDYSKVFQRQDTQEFEYLERECKDDLQNNTDCKVKNVKQERYTNNEKRNVIIKQDTEEFQDLERNCNTSVETPKYLSDISKCEKATPEPDITLNEEKNELNNANISHKAIVKEQVNGDVLMEKTDLPEKSLTTGHVKVRVSGNVCNATALSENIDQIDSKMNTEKPFTGINLKYDLIKDNLDNSNLQSKTISNMSQNTTEMTMNVNIDLPSNKTDEAVTEALIEQSKIANKNDQKPKSSENIAIPKSRVECRPSTRSIRNKTQVIDKPILLKETSEEMNNENSNNKNICVSNELMDKQLNDYKIKSDELKNEVDRLQVEIDTIKKENMRKDKYILTCALDIEVQKSTNERLKKLIREYEKMMAKQNEDLERLKGEAEKNSKHFTSTEMAFADVFEKYEKTKIVIEAYKKNEEILQTNLQCAEDQLTKLEAKCSVMREQFKEQLNKAQEQMNQETKKYRLEKANLQAMVKRLEIKASSLETALKQKTEECQALSTLCDDITGKKM